MQPHGTWVVQSTILQIDTIIYSMARPRETRDRGRKSGAQTSGAGGAGAVPCCYIGKAGAGPQNSWAKAGAVACSTIIVGILPHFQPFLRKMKNGQK